MPRAIGNDLCEIFGYAPDDTSDSARKQWKSQNCPFVGGVCIKHSHSAAVIFGSCSVANKGKGEAKEEVILCPNRFYAQNYKVLKDCIIDAIGFSIPMFMASEYQQKKRLQNLPKDYCVLLGKGSGKEIKLGNRETVQLSLDWVMARITNDKLSLIIPCEVQSIDITGNYNSNWEAYSQEQEIIPNSQHGMNWANVWKRLIPQLILKGSIALTSKLCSKGSYFVVPDRVYIQFEKLVGKVQPTESTGVGVLNVMTYGLGPNVPFGSIRQLQYIRTIRMLTKDFAESFASAGPLLGFGEQLETSVLEALRTL